MSPECREGFGIASLWLKPIADFFLPDLYMDLQLVYFEEDAYKYFRASARETISLCTETPIGSGKWGHIELMQRLNIRELKKRTVFS